MPRQPIKLEPITDLRQMKIYKLTGDSTTTTITSYPIKKKLSCYPNIFYYLKLVCDILEGKLYDFKQQSNIKPDEYDLLYVLIKKIREAIIDAYNEYVRINPNAQL